jgi:hypothetical protein
MGLVDAVELISLSLKSTLLYVTTACASRAPNNAAIPITAPETLLNPGQDRLIQLQQPQFPQIHIHLMRPRTPKDG